MFTSNYWILMHATFSFPSLTSTFFPLPNSFFFVHVFFSATHLGIWFYSFILYVCWVLSNIFFLFNCFAILFVYMHVQYMRIYRKKWKISVYLCSWVSIFGYVLKDNILKGFINKSWADISSAYVGIYFWIWKN